MILFCENLKQTLQLLLLSLAPRFIEPSMPGECSAHKGFGAAYRDNRQGVEPQFVLALKIQIKYAQRCIGAREKKQLGGGGEMVWGLPKTSHQFAAAAKQFTLDIVNFRRSSAQKSESQKQLKTKP